MNKEYLTSIGSIIEDGKYFHNSILAIAFKYNSQNYKIIKNNYHKYCVVQVIYITIISDTKCKIILDFYKRNYIKQMCIQ